MTIQTSARLSSDASAVLKVERPFYEQQQFNSELNYCIPEDDKRTSCSQWICNMKPTNILLSIFPVLSWLSQYNIKNDLIGDVISGCTVAIMHIPQGKSLPRLQKRDPMGENVVEFMLWNTFLCRNGLRNACQYTTNYRHLYGIFSSSNLFYIWHIKTQFDGHICCDLNNGGQNGA